MAASKKTEVVTQTAVVDNTEAPASRGDIAYHETSEDIGNGVIRITYGEPVGGFSEPDDGPATEEGEDA